MLSHLKIPKSFQYWSDINWVISSESGTALRNGKSDCWNMNILFICVTARESRYLYHLNLSSKYEKSKKLKLESAGRIYLLHRWSSLLQTLSSAQWVLSEHPRARVEQNFFFFLVPFPAPLNGNQFNMQWTFSYQKHSICRCLFVESCEENFWNPISLCKLELT